MTTILPPGTDVYFGGSVDLAGTIVTHFIAPEQSAELGSEYQPNGKLGVFYQVLLAPQLRFFNPQQTIFISSITVHSDGVTAFPPLPSLDEQPPAIRTNIVRSRILDALVAHVNSSNDLTEETVASILTPVVEAIRDGR